MDDQMMAGEFQMLQNEVLSTRTDKNLRNFFMSDSRLRPIFMVTGKINESIVNSFITNSSVKAGIQGERPTKLLGLVDRVFVDVAADLGSSRKTLENRHVVVVAGTANASTVSASIQKVFVTTNSGIIDDMTLPELRHVLGHEIGHTRAMHNISRLMNAIIMETLANELGINEDSALSVKKLRALAIDSFQEEHFGEAIETMVNGGKIDGLLSMLQSFMTQLSDEQRRDLLGNYLALVIDALERAPGTRENLEYFKNVLEVNIVQGRNLPLNRATFEKHAQYFSMLLSREHELTADRYGTTISRNRDAASSFAKLEGIKFTKEEQQSVLDFYTKRATEFYTGHGPQERARLIVGSHPPLMIRISNILNVDRFSTLLFADPFLRLLTFEDYLREKIGYLEVTITKQEDAELKEHLQKITAKLAAGHDQLLDSILNLMTKDFYMTDPKTGKPTAVVGLNPRLRKFVEFELAMRQIKLNAQGAIRETLAQRFEQFQKEAKPEDIEAAKAQITSLTQQLEEGLNQPNPLAQKLAEKLALKTNLKFSPKAQRNIVNVQSDLAEISKTKTIEDTQQLRLAIDNRYRAIIPERKSNHKLPVDLEGRTKIRPHLHKGPVALAKQEDDASSEDLLGNDEEEALSQIAQCNMELDRLKSGMLKFH
jgi:hypothetical protein